MRTGNRPPPSGTERLGARGRSLPVVRGRVGFRRRLPRMGSDRVRRPRRGLRRGSRRIATRQVTVPSGQRSFTKRESSRRNSDPSSTFGEPSSTLAQPSSAFGEPCSTFDEPSPTRPRPARRSRAGRSMKRKRRTPFPVCASSHSRSVGERVLRTTQLTGTGTRRRQSSRTRYGPRSGRSTSRSDPKRR